DRLVHGQRGLRHAELIALSPHVATLADLDLERLGQCVDDRGPHAVQPAGHLVARTTELATGVQLGQHQLHSRLLLDRVDVGGDAPAVVYDADAAVLEDGDVDPVGVPGHRLIDGVVDDLPDQVVQSALPGRADVHPRPLADRF